MKFDDAIQHLILIRDTEHAAVRRLEREWRLTEAGVHREKAEAMHRAILELTTARRESVPPKPKPSVIPPNVKPTRWQCGKGHVFVFGDEEWHREVTQGYEPELGLIPMYCTEDAPNGETCMDSSSLVGLGYER